MADNQVYECRKCHLRMTFPGSHLATGKCRGCGAPLKTARKLPLRDGPKPLIITDEASSLSDDFFNEARRTTRGYNIGNQPSAAIEFTAETERDSNGKTIIKKINTVHSVETPDPFSDAVRRPGPGPETKTRSKEDPDAGN